MASNAPKKAKVLRIGLFQNNRIIEERLFRTPSPVTIGSDFKKNTFVVPASALPKTQTVFDFKGGKYLLHVTKQMTGRIKSGDQINTIQDLIQNGKAQKGANGGYTIVLAQSSQGRVTVGDATLLFQFVTPPPPRPKPVLPASMRGGWIQGLDRILVTSTSIVAILFIGFVAFLESRDWPVPLERQQILQDQFVQIMLNKKEEPPPEPDEPEVDPSADGEPDEVAEKPKEEPKKAEKPKEEPKEEPAGEPDKPKSADELAQIEAERKRRLAEEVQNKTILGQIGAVTDDGSGGGIVNMLADGAGATSMDEAFEGSVGVKTGVAGAEKSGLRSSGSKDAKGQAVGGVKLGKGKLVGKANKGVSGPSKSEKTIKSRVKFAGATKAVGGKLDSNAISKALKRKSGQFQKCHERELKKNPKAGGKVTVMFVIGGAGRVTSAKLVTDSVGGTVGGCVSGVIKRIRFPRPKGGDATVKKSFVFSAAS